MKFKPIKRISYQDQIYDLLLQAIKEGDYKPGEKLPAISVLAERFNVSISPTRLAIQKLDENGYVESRHGSGTYVIDPFERFSEKDSACICFDFRAHLFSEIYLSLVQSFQDIGKYSFSLNPDSSNFIQLLEKFLKSETKLFIYTSTHYFDLEKLKPELLKGKTFIRILQHEGIDDPLNPSMVLVNLKHGTEVVINHLKEKGHKHILVVGPENMLKTAFSRSMGNNSKWHISRRKYTGITFSELISLEKNDQELKFDQDQLMDFLTGNNNATAIIGLRDYEIAMIQRVLLKKAPDLLKKLDLIGFGNTPFSQCTPLPFSSVDYNIAELSEQVCRLATMVYRQKSFKPEKIFIEPKLIIR